MRQLEVFVYQIPLPASTIDGFAFEIKKDLLCQDADVHTTVATRVQRNKGVRRGHLVSKRGRGVRIVRRECDRRHRGGASDS